MALSLLDCEFAGPALPEPFVKFQLEEELNRRKLLAGGGKDGKAIQAVWDVYRRKLRALGDRGGYHRVAAHVLEPLTALLGYTTFERDDEVVTREGAEDGGWRMVTADGAVLRAWSVESGVDLDAPNRRGRAYRFSPSRIAQRVLHAKGERVGLLTDGDELRLLLCDPAYPESHIAVRLDRTSGWRSARAAPDSYRLLLALASPAGLRALPDLIEAARLAQSTVTRKLRLQARRAIEGFLQGVLDHPTNEPRFAKHHDREALARTLWAEGLVVVYRLLFILKLESSSDPARVFSFANHALWRGTYSPNVALAPLVRQALDGGVDTGTLLEGGLRQLWKMFAEGLDSVELAVKPLGGMLFGPKTTPLLDTMTWGERAVAHLLDALLWTPGGGRDTRERVHYGALDVEDLGRVYESLLELDPGIATEPMCRLRRAKLEVVRPLAEGERYRPAVAPLDAPDLFVDQGDDDGSDEGGEEDAAPARAGKGKKGAKGSKTKKSDAKTQVQWIEAIPAGRFFLRVGLGRKASGSYYTPHPFVRFLVDATLGPQIKARSPESDPHPAAILALRVLDPAMGSGHFLVEACRYLGLALYEACRLCDELAVEEENAAERATEPAAKERHLARALELRRRVEDLPDQNDELVAYLPSRVTEGEASGLSQRKAEAICRRLVAVHCLYGVDKNELAVGLARVVLWLEAHAEGLPLTFLNHRLVHGDSLSGPLSDQLLTWPRSGERIEDDLFARKLPAKLQNALASAMVYVRDLEASIGTDLKDIAHKELAKERLDAALAPFQALAAAWSGGVRLGPSCDDAAFKALAEGIVEGRRLEELLAALPSARAMKAEGELGLSYDLRFPEVFHPDGRAARGGGFDAVIGNPPWDAVQPLAKEFFAALDLRILDAATRAEREPLEDALLAVPATSAAFNAYLFEVDATKRSLERLTPHAGKEAGGRSSGAVMDVWQGFAERGPQLLRSGGRVGWVLPSAFHANQSATGIRELYLEQLALSCCFSFENRNKLFEIDSRFKFAAIVAEGDARGTREFDCAFYLHDLEWLFTDKRPLRYSRQFVEGTGAEYRSFLELRTVADADAVSAMYSAARSLGDVLGGMKIHCGEEIHMSKGSSRFSATSDVTSADPRDPQVALTLREQGYFVLHEGKTFHQFEDRWSERPRYLVHTSQLEDKRAWMNALRFFRLAFRAVASSTNERTCIATVIPPGNLFGHSANAERSPEKRPTSAALMIVAMVGTFAFDWCLRLRVGSNVSHFFLETSPIPGLQPGQARFLAHAALRLTCNHAGYAALWHEQLGDLWREPTPPHSWPILADPDARWTLRAAIDAVVADAYGLSRDQYVHILSTFSHASYPQAPERCLAAFDDLKARGLAEFLRHHDPYSDAPLVDALPQPVISLGATQVASTPSPAGPAVERTVERTGQVQLIVEHGPLFANLPPAAYVPPAVDLPHAADAPRRATPPTAARHPALVPETTTRGKRERSPVSQAADEPTTTPSPLAGAPYHVLLDLLRERGTITSSDAQTATGLGPNEVRPHLRRLVDEGHARIEGQKRGTRYVHNLIG